MSLQSTVNRKFLVGELFLRVFVVFGFVGWLYLFSGDPLFALDDSNAALALLRGVELARTAYDTGRLEFEVEFVVPPRGKINDGAIEFDRLHRRSQSTEKGELLHTVIVDGDEIYDYVASPYTDVRVLSLDDAATGKDLVAFDPRILGLSDMMAMDTSVSGCLWRDGMESPVLIGKEQIAGVEVWRVKLQRSQSTSFEYWIEEPSFRVHRVTMTWPKRYVEILSTFSESFESLFPIRVIAKRHVTDEDKSVRETVFERVYTVKKFESGKNVSPDRFSLASMDLPHNTPINDYRISRIVGYWDGEGISPQPSFGRQQAPSPPSTQGIQMSRTLIILNVVIVIGLLFMVFRRRFKV